VLWLTFHSETVARGARAERFLHSHWLDVCLAAIHCAESDVVDTFKSYLVRCVWFHVAFALCFALPLYAHLAWLLVWVSCLPCRNWCNFMIIIGGDGTAANLAWIQALVLLMLKVLLIC
jgi:hypothetical protein